MWERARNVWNRLWNTAMIGPRAVGTALNTVTDAVDTVIEVPKRVLSVVKNTIHEMKKVLVEPWKYWKWYQRVWNIALSPLIATWVAIEWAGKAVLTPAEWAVDTWNTAKNTLKNGWRSTFGRLFSKKPLSDFSYDKLQTANFINKDKYRVSKLQFGKKDWVWVETPSTKKSSWKEAAAAAAATAAAAASAKEIANLNSKISSLTEENAKIQKQLNEVLAANKKLAEENAELKKNIKELVETIKKNSKPAEAKPIEKPAEKPAEKPIEAKPDKEWKWDKSEKKEDTKEKKKTDEKWSEWEKVVDADRISEFVDLPERSKPIASYLKRKYPEMEYRFSDHDEDWHIHLDNDSQYIKIWTKNLKKVPIQFLHEWFHAAIHDNVPWTEELVTCMQTLNKKYWKQLFSVSNNKIYDTPEKKATEDACEWAALFALSAQGFNKHMEYLQKWANEHLAKISEWDAENIKKLCEKIISNLEETTAKTVKMYDDTAANTSYSKAA